MNSKISLFVLAAGMGSRYGGLKQMEGFGPSGETIVDYSIYDAVRAGFEKIVFVIKPEMEEAFKEIFLSKYGDKVEIDYVFQTLDMVPSWYKVNPERVKPWGTGQALLVSRDKIKEPCYVISSDDFYGAKTFELVASFLRNECTKDLYCIPVYPLENVMSNFGTVNRGICYVKDGFLEKIEEAFNVKRNDSGEFDGENGHGDKVDLKKGTLAAMSSYGIHPTIFDPLSKRFEDFLKKNKDELTGESLLPNILGDMISAGEVRIKVLETGEKWFGVTNREDGPIVREKLADLVRKGVYPEKIEL